MANPPNTAARLYITPAEQSLLERYGVTSQEFNLAHDHRDLALDRDSGSEMVQNDRPERANKPDRDNGHPVDRAAFDRQWAHEIERARQNQPEQEQSFDQEYSR